MEVSGRVRRIISVLIEKFLELTRNCKSETSRIFQKSRIKYKSKSQQKQFNNKRSKKLNQTTKNSRMVDWNGLYKWSMEYQDGTHPSSFKPMSKEDRKWLEEAMKAHTFNDTDRLTELINQLKQWSAQAATAPDESNAQAAM